MRMTPIMTPDQFNQIVNLLKPQMGDTASRQALLTQALHGCALYDQISFAGPAQAFTVNFVRQADAFGECQPGTPALVSVLETLKGQVGLNKQREIDELIAELLGDGQTKAKGTKMTPLDAGILIGFLLEVGRWAKSELSERWKLRREQQETDLSNRQEVQQSLPEQIEQIATERSQKEAERTIALIERKRDAIDRARNAKLADREQFDRGEMLQSAFEQLQKKHNTTIREMMDEIETDLIDLGFDVKRESA
jgi:hypothetical protein